MTALRLFLLGAAALAFVLPARAGPAVEASIKPVHSLVAAVMAGVGEPGLIVQGAGSPHTYSLKPSQAADLERSELIFWIGPAIEAFLVKPLDTVAQHATTVELMDAPGVVKLGLREGGSFEQDDDGDADHGAFDSHVWLDPENARAFVATVAEALAGQDPANAVRYRANAAAAAEKIDALEAEVRAILQPVKGREFIVFHDAYLYFESRFGMPASGSITISPEVTPGAARIGEIRAKVGELGAACVFAEPEFEPRLISAVIEGTEAKTGVLDPLGADLEDGPELYFDLIRNLATSMRDCLSGEG